MVDAPPVQAEAVRIAAPPVAMSGEPAQSGWIFACFWNAVAFAYLLSGSVRFDARIALAPGFSLNQLLGLVVLGKCAWDLRSLRRAGIAAPTTVVTVLVLTLLLAIRCAGTPNLPYGLFKVASYGLLVLPVLLHVQLHVRTRTEHERFLWIPASAMAVLLVAGLPDILAIHQGERLAVLHGGPNVLARHLGTGTFCLVVLLWLRRRRRRPTPLFLATWIPLAGVALLLTGTKTVLLSLPLALVFVFWKAGRSRVVLALVAGLFFFALLPLLTHRLVANLPKDGGVVRLLRLPDVDDPLGSYGARMIYVRGTWDEVRRHPWIGVGTGGWGMRLSLGYAEAYPHNILLELLAELGVIGLALVLLPLCTFPRPGFTRGQCDPLTIGLAGLALFWTLNVQVSGDVVDSRFLWIWLAIFESHLRGARRSGGAGAGTRDEDSPGSAELVWNAGSR
jgi:O-antigen ligase